MQSYVCTHIYTHAYTHTHTRVHTGLVPLNYLHVSTGLTLQQLDNVYGHAFDPYTLLMLFGLGECVCVCTYVCRVSVYVRVCVCVYVSVCVRVYVRARTHITT